MNCFTWCQRIEARVEAIKLSIYRKLIEKSKTTGSRQHGIFARLFVWYYFNNIRKIFLRRMNGVSYEILQSVV